MAAAREQAGILIVGAGQAGLQLATSLRGLGATGRVTLVGGEAHPPYQRPPLSKSFQLTEQPPAPQYLRGHEFYAANGIDLVCGEWVQSIRLLDRVRGAGEAVTRTGRVLAFDRLALTTGGAPRRLNVPGHGLPGIHYLRAAEDAVALHRRLLTARRVVVVGGGFIGLEVAASATALGRRVTVVEAADRLMSRVVAPVVSNFYADAHRRRGTTIILGASVAAFHGGTQVERVELSDGRFLDADLVVIGVGLMPHVELAEQLGLAVAGGIVVDQLGRTSDQAVVAAGDCTVLSDSRIGMVRMESVNNAIAQARVAAATLLGAAPPARGVPWFWSDQADLKLQMAGLSSPGDEVVVRGVPASESFSVLYYRNDELVAINTVNAPRDYLAVRRILESGNTIPMDVAADTSIPLPAFLKTPAA